MSSFEQSPQLPPRPWYRELWVWFVIALPLSVVIAGTTTAIIAISGADALVVDDFQKVGLVARREGAKERMAARLNIVASVALDRENGNVTVRLQGDTQARLLQLGLHHPTRADFDRALTLNRDATGLYRGTLSQAIKGHWHVQLADETQGWRIKGMLAGDRDLVELDGRN